MRWQIPLVVSLALLVAVSCDQQPVEPQTDEAAATPLFAPAEGNGGKIVWGWSDDIPAAVDCGGGVVLDLNDTGYAQELWKKVASKQLGHIVWHITLTYTDPSTGKSFKIHDVGPDNYYFSKNCTELTHSINGRSVTGSGIIGHVVQCENGVVDIIQEAGRPAGDPNELACQKLG